MSFPACRPASELISIKPLQNSSDYSIKIVKSEQSCSYGFSSAKFLNEFDLKIDKLTRFEPIWRSEIKMLVLEF